MTDGVDDSYVLVDTNAFVELTRSQKRAQRLLPYVRDKRIVLSFVTVAELRRGAYRMNYSQQSWDRLSTDITRAVVVPPSDDLSHEWARVSDEARRAGKPLGQKGGAHDAWVAATARVYDLVLLSEDHGFDDCHGLRLLPDRNLPSSI